MEAQFIIEPTSKLIELLALLFSLRYLSMNALAIVSAKTNTQLQQSNNEYFDEFQQFYFLQEVVESFIDGILIITEQGNLIHANECGKQICLQLNQNLFVDHLIPQEIWHICCAFIDTCHSFSDQSIVFYDEISIEQLTARVRVQWLNVAQLQRQCLLVTLENQCQVVEYQAIAEAQRYGLTPSETKVWLLYRANYTYKQIAAELYITINTVKKHMKNIHAKRKATLDTEE